MKHRLWRSLSLLAGLILSLPLLAEPVPLVVSGPHPNAPAELGQYGQLVGDWACRGANRQPDGTWLQSPHPPATWSWYYVLDGYAVQDVWRPGDGSSPWGTNLRTFDPESGQWHMVWATQQQARFDQFTASYADGSIVMLGQRWARAQFPAHTARITFYDIEHESYEWKYESQQADGSWNAVARLSCARAAGKKADS